MAEEDAFRKGRLPLILAAERMIAVHGVGGVSLRQINEVAGHRNSGATHYHFGSRQGLIQAVLSWRMTAIDARRRMILDAWQGLPSGLGIRDLIGALAYPLVEELKPRTEGNYFLRFSERVVRERAQFNFEPDSPKNAWRFTQDELLRRLDHIPQPLAELRVKMAWDQLISGLASVEAKLEQGAWGIDAFLATETLIDFVAAGVVCPIAPQVLAEMARVE